MQSRRKFITAAAGASAVLATVPLAGKVLAAPHPDAELLALGRELDIAWTAERLVPSSAPDAEMNSAIERCSATVDSILAVPAKTAEGLQVKARALLWCGHEVEELNDLDVFGGTTDLHLAASIVRDLLSMASA